MTRRRLLGSAAAVAAGAGFELLPPSMKKTLAASPPTAASLDQVEHVVILMQENRSFDSYFGTLSGVRGYSDPTVQRLSTGRSVFFQPDSLNPDGFELPFHMDTTKTSAAAIADLSHAWTAQLGSWNGGRMDNWLPAHRKADGNTDGPLTMGYFTRQDVPWHYALADAFTICDMTFCSIFGPTWPNRMFLMTGTIDPDGKNGGPIITNSEPHPFTWTTYPERLQAAGISWRVYQEADNFGTNMLTHFAQFQQAPQDSPLFQNGLVTRSHTAFMDDVKNHRLPQVSWILVPSVDSEHPPFLPAKGAQFVNDILDALGSTPDVWAKTVLFLTYDENDGFFDHVPPPTPPPGTPGEFLTVDPLPSAAGGIAGPVGLGFRVPMIIISPWSTGGWVYSGIADHTSIIRFMETRFGVMEPNISAWRRRTVTDLTAALRFPQPNLRFPTLPDPAPLIELEQQEAATLPPPTVPAQQSMPAQEPGTRPHIPSP